MKLVSFLIHATVATGTAFLFGLAFDLHALALFGIAITTAMLLVTVTDYTSLRIGVVRLSLHAPAPGTRGRGRAKYKLPFAA